MINLRHCETAPCIVCVGRRVRELERQLKPVEILKDASSTLAVYPIEDKSRIDELLLLDKVGKQFYEHLSFSWL